ncbi:MAG: AAA family ATPase [Phototrophicaceae bacterium]
MSIHLRSIRLPKDKILPTGFPFDVPVIKQLDTLEFNSPITFFVGENGSGKSTVLEAIASAASLPTVGSAESGADETLASIRELGNHLKWVWSKRIPTGFFMRSEDFFGFTKRISSEVRYLEERLKAGKEHEGQSDYALAISKQGYARDYQALKDLYGTGLDAQSHGESYFKLFQARFRAGGLYLMDEPEAPLSPNRQLTLIAMLKQMIDQDAQFIIATHSPILLAYPNASIYNFTGGRIEQADYESLEHVQITRDFLNNPQAYLRHLLE